MSSNSFSAFMSCDDTPTIQIQYVDQQNTFSDYPPASPYATSPGLGHSDFLSAFRSNASDSGSDCQSPASCPSSPSLSPYLGANSPAPRFASVNVDIEKLSLDHSSNGTELYRSYQPSTHSLHELSAAPDSESGHFSHLQGGSVYPYDHLTLQPGRLRRSMPNILDCSSSEYSPSYLDGMIALSRSPSSSSGSSFNPDMYTPNETQDVHNPMFSMEFLQDSIPLSGPSRSNSADSISMNNIKDLIDKDFTNGRGLDARQIQDNLAQTVPGHRRVFLKPPKNTVATAAGQLASDKRRKHPGRFLCNIANCSASFTRKLGLDNHIKSHLGITDQECSFCHKLFSTSLGRHMKRCKQNPSREPPSSKRSNKQTFPL